MSASSSTLPRTAASSARGCVAQLVHGRRHHAGHHLRGPGPGACIEGSSLGRISRSPRSRSVGENSTEGTAFDVSSWAGSAEMVAGVVTAAMGKLRTTHPGALEAAGRGSSVLELADAGHGGCTRAGSRCPTPKARTSHHSTARRGTTHEDVKSPPAVSC